MMKTSDNYIIMIRMLKVLWYYNRPKVNKYATENNPISVISDEGDHMCNEAKLIP